jgi:hypothetical protein
VSQGTLNEENEPAPAVVTSPVFPPSGRLRDPAGQGGCLPDPRPHLRLVELVVLVDVDVAHVLVLGLAGRERSQ